MNKDKKEWFGRSRKEVVIGFCCALILPIVFLSFTSFIVELLIYIVIFMVLLKIVLSILGR